MRTPTPWELLEGWERGRAAAPAERGMALLAIAQSASSNEALWDLPLGERNRRLLLLREILFGRQMSAVVACPRCGERLELTLDTAEICGIGAAPPSTEIAFSILGYDMTLRLPSSSAVVAAAGQPDAASSHQALLQHCVVAARRDGVPAAIAQLPGEVVEAAEQRLAEADPLADIRIALSCPACRQTWRAAFDVLSFLWSEIEVWAWRTLADVHTLASAYGWGEREILSLTPLRRQFYLEMVGA